MSTQTITRTMSRSLVNGFWTEYTLERRTRHVFGTLVVLLLIAYTYLIAASTFNIIARKDAHLAATKVESSLAQLEAQYFALSEELSPERAAVLGFVPVDDKQYVTRTTRLGLSTPTNQ